MRRLGTRFFETGMIRGGTVERVRAAVTWWTAIPRARRLVAAVVAVAIAGPLAWAAVAHDGGDDELRLSIGDVALVPTLPPTSAVDPLPLTTTAPTAPTAPVTAPPTTRPRQVTAVTPPPVPSVVPTTTVVPLVEPEAPKYEWVEVDRAERGNLYRASVDRQRLLLLRPYGMDGGQSRAFGPVWSPDGTTLAFGHDSRIVMTDVRTGRAWWPAPDAAVGVLAFRFRAGGWAPDSRSFVFADQHGDLVVVGRDGGAPLRITEDRSRYAGLVRVSPVDPLVAFVVGGRELWVVGLDGAGTRRVYEDPNGPNGITEVQWAPDGRTLAVVSGSYLRLVPLDGGPPSPPLSERGADWRLSWAPAGDRLAFGSSSPDGQSIWTVRRDGTGERPLTDPGTVGATWSPRGDLISYIGQGPATPGPSTLEIGESFWVVHPDGSGRRQVCAFASRFKPFFPTSWSPDGTELAFALDGT